MPRIAVTIGEAGEFSREVGRRCRDNCARLGLTQTDVGEAIGCSYQQIHKYFNGFNRIPTFSLKRLADLFEVDIDSLIPSLESVATPKNNFMKKPGARCRLNVMADMNSVPLYVQKRIAASVRMQVDTYLDATIGREDDEEDAA